MIKRDFHIHTSYCDGKDSPEDIVKTAIAKGFSTIGFSGHSPLAGESWCMSENDVEKYRQEIAKLQEKYRAEIEILCGIEQDYFSKKTPGYEDFDYVIGSVHCLNTCDGLVSLDDTAEILKDVIDKYFGGDALSLAEEYFKTLSDVVKVTGADIVGHFDLILKFNEADPMFDTTHPRYIKAYEKALEKLTKENVLFEVNTGAMTRGYRSVPYPDKMVLERMAQLQANVIITGDCHDKNYLGVGFDKALGLIKESGFKRIAYFSKGNINFTEI